MEAMRDVLRGSLGRSLRGIRDEDRLAAAWTVACGKVMADRGTVVGYEAGVVRVEVADAVWLRQMNSLRGVLERDMARIAGLRVERIEFQLARQGQNPPRINTNERGSKARTKARAK
jgi:Dna[CI] antecedent, DciA